MPSPFGCAIEDVYSDWNFKKPTTPPNLLQPGSQSGNQLPNQLPTHQLGSNQHAHPQLNPVPNNQNQNQNQPFHEDQDLTYIPNNNGLRTFCPNCQNCLNANDVLQQKIVEVNTWPRPRWTPQYPNAYVPFDPFNRYWMNNVPSSHIEEFGNVNMYGGNMYGGGNMYEHFGQGQGKGSGNMSGNMSTETLLQVILFILIALFIIQLVECLYMRCTE